jgi:hypothetical protein
MFVGFVLLKGTWIIRETVPNPNFVRDNCFFQVYIFHSPFFICVHL